MHKTFNIVVRSRHRVALTTLCTVSVDLLHCLGVGSVCQTTHRGSSGLAEIRIKFVEALTNFI